MVSKSAIYCVIPARGGSKRIPRKNIRDFLGVPIIGRVITTALGSGIFDRVIVTTEDQEIADVAKSFGAEVPFLRPLDLADDITPTIPVIRQSILANKLDCNAHNIVCCLYPTAVLATKKDLISSLEIFQKSNGNKILMALTRYQHPIQRAFSINTFGEFLPVNESAIISRTQDLETNWHDAGQFYFGTTKTWMEGVGFPRPFLGYDFPPSRVQDVDSLEDWQRAEQIYTINFGA